MQPDISENTFDAGIVTINYAEISSSSTPLVLLHGGSNRWQSFDNILSDLAAVRHVYAPDFRGHGKSTWVPGTYRLQDYADDTIAFLQHCLKEPAYVFGHSLGGMVALLVAAQFPDGVRAVAVGDAPLSSQAWQAILHQSRDRLLAWRDLAGGQKPFDEVVEALKNPPSKCRAEWVLCQCARWRAKMHQCTLGLRPTYNKTIRICLQPCLTDTKPLWRDMR